MLNWNLDAVQAKESHQDLVRAAEHQRLVRTVRAANSTPTRWPPRMLVARWIKTAGQLSLVWATRPSPAGSISAADRG